MPPRNGKTPFLGGDTKTLDVPTSRGGRCPIHLWARAKWLYRSDIVAHPARRGRRPRGRRFCASPRVTKLMALPFAAPHLHTGCGLAHKSSHGDADGNNCRNRPNVVFNEIK